MHIICAGYYYKWEYETFQSFVTRALKKQNLKSVMVTNLSMRRENLITKETTTNLCLGKTDLNGNRLEGSVCDDIESVFENLQLGKRPKPWAHTYFLPRLTEEEMELVERGDQVYFQTFHQSENPDVRRAEMMLSESDSKYVRGLCQRNT